MGFFTWTETACTACGAHGALQRRGRIRCPKADCVHHDPRLLRGAPAASGRGAGTAAPASRMSPEPQGTRFDPGEHAVHFGYTNHEGLSRTFVGDLRTLRGRGRFVSLRVAPTGRRLSFARDRIAFGLDVETAVGEDDEPYGVDHQVLAYHFKYGTTSPRHQEVLKRFPDWRP